MLRQILCLVALLVEVCSAKPDFCRELDCPNFKVEEKSTFYELRCYDTYNWVSTDAEDRSNMMRGGKFFKKMVKYMSGGKREKYSKKEGKSSSAFWRLFRYISGENDMKEKIPMTVPVLMSKPLDSKKPVNKTMSFFIPLKNQENPPKPTDDEVRITEMKSLCVYVRSWEGFMQYSWLPWGEMLNKRMLTWALSWNGLGNKYHPDYYYTAGYNSPMDFMYRHNEIWFVKK